MHPVEAFGHIASLVALQVADEMPGDRQVFQRGDFRDGFLAPKAVRMASGGCDFETATNVTPWLSP
jgi:hypothetical protein